MKDEPATEAQRIRILAVCREAGIEESERHRLSVLLGGKESVKDLSLVEAKRVLAGLDWLLDGGTL